ncbi:hypothetical protein LX16_0152 [Stackebrandtia albiflava]|uniref:Probable membrane transporter protein n=1 Tax=Stackebrandtia albiflava TaxID=406432 RepID=A0A562VGE3_9ACTN|nr:TSUP family transporter [Stackebrandtia albiflava]TWJ16901.1 hypothetical protein LX16_0152 [Stackebrandtia albiflava]
METLAPSVLLVLFGVALMAGAVDAVAGGGGLLTLPALLLAGVPPVNALATNKLQSSFGTFTSAFSMYRKGMTEGAPLVAPFCFALAGSAVGTAVVQFVDTSALTVVVPVVLAGIALYFIFMPKQGDGDRVPRMGAGPYRSVVVPVIGFYDGAFGPGTGSFFTAAGVSLRGLRVVPATAQARMWNFATNVASLVVFAIGGKMLWLVGAVMAVGQVVGAYLGAAAVSRGGARLVRPVVVVVCLAMLVQYLWRQGWLGW